MNNSLIILVPLIVASFIYDSVSVGGLGLPFLLLTACLLYGLVTLAKTSSSGQRSISFMYVSAIRNPFFYYLAFSLCFLIALLYTGSTSSVDLTYWYSVVGQALWFPAVWWITYRSSGKFEKVFDLSVLSVITIIILFWLLGVLQTTDPFFLRNSIDHFDSFSLAPDLFSTPNRTARTLILLIMYCMYKSRSIEGNSGKIWSRTAIVVTILLFFTLSRSGIASVIILWVLYSIDPQQIKKSKAISLAIIVTAVCSILLTPGIGDRLEQIIVTVSDIGDNYSTGVVDARSMTLRARSWTASLQIIGDNPLFGVGVSEALNTMEFYGSVGYKGSTELKTIWVHGGFLKISVYAGIATLIMFVILLWIIGKSFAREYKVSSRANRVQAASASWVGLSGMIASLPVNIGADFFGTGIVWFILSFLLAKSVLRN